MYICNICYTSTSTSLMLQCQCVVDYHEQCLGKWLDTKNTCPTCRQITFLVPKWLQDSPPTFTGYIKQALRNKTTPLCVFRETKLQPLWKQWITHYDFPAISAQSENIEGESLSKYITQTNDIDLIECFLDVSLDRKSHITVNEFVTASVKFPHLLKHRRIAQETDTILTDLFWKGDYEEVVRLYDMVLEANISLSQKLIRVLICGHKEPHLFIKHCKRSISFSNNHVRLFLLMTNTILHNSFSELTYLHWLASLERCSETQEPDHVPNLILIRISLSGFIKSALVDCDTMSSTSVEY